jgi:hypothetical protein
LSVEVTQLINEPGGQSDNYKESIWEIGFYFILAYLATENLTPVIIIIIIIIITIKIIPVIIGATGTISKSFRKYVNNIPGNHEVKELQKTAIGTAHILRKVLT